jgi:hypothetical protein
VNRYSFQFEKVVFHIVPSAFTGPPVFILRAAKFLADSPFNNVQSVPILVYTQASHVVFTLPLFFSRPVRAFSSTVRLLPRELSLIVSTTVNEAVSIIWANSHFLIVTVNYIGKVGDLLISCCLIYRVFANSFIHFEKDS